MADPKFTDGERVVIVGNKATAEPFGAHGFETGGLGVIVNQVHADPNAYVVQADGDEWWVHEADLMPATTSLSELRELLLGEDGREGIPEEYVASGEVDMVNHPPHYKTLQDLGIEVIDITERFNFNLGNALKYIMRADHKHDDGGEVDLAKAEWYIARERKRRQKHRESREGVSAGLRAA